MDVKQFTDDFRLRTLYTRRFVLPFPCPSFATPVFGCTGHDRDFISNPIPAYSFCMHIFSGDYYIRSHVPEPSTTITDGFGFGFLKPERCTSGSCPDSRPLNRMSWVHHDKLHDKDWYRRYINSAIINQADISTCMLSVNLFPTSSRMSLVLVNMLSDRDVSQDLSQDLSQQTCILRILLAFQKVGNWDMTS